MRIRENEIAIGIATGQLSYLVTGNCYCIIIVISQSCILVVSLCILVMSYFRTKVVPFVCKHTNVTGMLTEFLKLDMIYGSSSVVVHGQVIYIILQFSSSKLAFIR